MVVLLTHRIQQRHASRLGNKSGGAAAGGPTQAEKIGYVSRQQVAGLKSTGLASAGMMGSKNKNAADQELDDESAAGLKEVRDADAEIDAGVSDISDSMDRLQNMASTMGTDIKEHDKKLDKMNAAAQRAGEKQVVVNQRLKRQLK